VTLAEKTFMVWTSPVARPVTVTQLDRSLGLSVMPRQGNVSVSPTLEGDSAMTVWRDISTYNKIIPSSVYLVTVIGLGQ
jgi:hypothetical protein